MSEDVAEEDEVELIPKENTESLYSLRQETDS